VIPYYLICAALRALRSFVSGHYAYPKLLFFAPQQELWIETGFFYADIRDMNVGRNVWKMRQGNCSHERPEFSIAS
jgi:hypothetical protein